VPQTEDAATSFPADGEGFDEEIVECFTVSETLTKFIGFGFELLVGEVLHFGFESVNGIDSWLQLLDISGIRRPEERGDVGLDSSCQSVEKVADVVPNAFKIHKTVPNTGVSLAKPENAPLLV
jgi:hypothetical protein